MQMAIDESHLSIPEHTDKTDPLVGAIIATADGVVLAKASWWATWRRALRIYLDRTQAGECESKWLCTFM